MVQKYYNSKEAAKVLGVKDEEITVMLDRRELHGYRDGADWKFKTEDIERLAAERHKSPPPVEEESGDVLLSERELGHSDPGASGTVIGMGRPGSAAADSNLKLDDDFEVAGAGKKDVDSKVAQFEELDLTLEEDLTLQDSSVKLSGKKPVADSPSGAGSAVDLTGKILDDDDLVLGGSGKGSDVSIGGDSGISLVDPADSGLSLEEPIHLGGAEESLELGEEDLLGVGEGTGAGRKLKADDDFLLTPLEEEGGDAEDSESGSQVIALDTEGDESATMIASSSAVSMAAMLEEDLSTQSPLDMGPGMASGAVLGGAALGAQGAFGEEAAFMQPSAMLPEAPYSGLQIAGLTLCALALILCGIMMHELLRNMWSWEGPGPVSSWLLDMLVGVKK